MGGHFPADVKMTVWKRFSGASEPCQTSKMELFAKIVCRSSPPEVFLRKSVLKICSKFTGEHPCRSVITLRHGCSPANLLHVLRTPFLKNNSEQLFLSVVKNNSETYLRHC